MSVTLSKVEGNVEDGVWTAFVWQRMPYLGDEEPVYQVSGLTQKEVEEFVMSALDCVLYELWHGGECIGQRWKVWTEGYVK